MSSSKKSRNFFKDRDLEHFPIPWHRKKSLALCFIAFSSREPVSTSLENAQEHGHKKSDFLDYTNGVRA
jgi:hypothetical protein